MNFEALKLSAEAGDAEEQCKLGEMFYYGFLIKQNKTEALKWFQLASEQGHQKAQALLERMRKK